MILHLFSRITARLRCFVGNTGPQRVCLEAKTASATRSWVPDFPVNPYFLTFLVYQCKKLLSQLP